MNKCDIIIDALNKGRELFPKQGRLNLFNDKETACALGAIAVGLGYVPKQKNYWDLNTEPRDEEAYYFLKLKLSELEVPFRYSDIYAINDEAMREGKDPDEEVIKYIKEECE